MKKYFFLLLILLVGLAGCKKNKQVLISIEKNEELEFRQSKFDLSLIKFIINDNKEIKKIPLTRDMITKEDYEKLLTIGEHEITVNYQKLEFKLIVKIIPDEEEIIKIYHEDDLCFFLSEFNLNKIKLIVDDGGVIKETTLNESMLDRNDLEKLTTVGEHQITVNYKGARMSIIVKLEVEPYVTISFVNEPELVPNMTIKKGSQVTLPTPKKKGYTFIGWYTGEGVNDGKFDNSMIVNENITLYARYVTNQYQVSFTENDENFRPIVVNFNDEINNLPTPYRDGYSFEGWIYENRKITFPFIYQYDENIVLSPLWQKEEYLYHVINGEVILDQYLGHNHDVLIPETINQMPVTRLCDNLFPNIDVFTIHLPQTIKVIDSLAFNNINTLTAITVDERNPFFIAFDGVLYNKDKTFLIKYPLAKSDKIFTFPQTLKTIESYALAYTINLEIVNLPEGLEMIDEHAFFSSSIQSITIPKTVLEIGLSAFEKASSLTEVNFAPGSSLQIIGMRAFSETSLVTITLPENLISLGKHAFFNISSLENIYVKDENIAFKDDDGVLYSFSYEKLILYPMGKEATSYQIKEETKVVSDNAFYQALYLERIICSSSLEKIANLAFANAQKLKTVIITSDNIITLGVDVFFNNDPELQIFVNPEVLSLYRDSWLTYDNLIVSYYQVRFISDEELISTTYVYPGGEVSVPEPIIKAGYTFISWDKDTSKINSDITIMALYEANKYNIFFITHGKLINPLLNVTFDSVVTLPIPEKPGNIFIKWTLNGVEISNPFTYKFTTDITLEAVWE